MADVDLGADAIGGTLQAHAELVDDAGRVQRAHGTAQYGTDAAHRQVGPLLHVVGFQESERRAVHIQFEALVQPELPCLWPDGFDGGADYQPALAAGAFHAHLVEVGQHGARFQRLLPGRI